MLYLSQLINFNINISVILLHGKTEYCSALALVQIQSFTTVL